MDTASNGGRRSQKKRRVLARRQTAASRAAFLVFFAALSGAPRAAARGFDEVFPTLDARIRKAAWSAEGFYRSAERGGAQDMRPSIASPSAAAAKEADVILERDPAALLETLALIPLEKTKRLSQIDVYNALGKTRALAGRRYYSHRRKKLTPLFEKLSRVADAESSKKIPDPPPADTLPAHEVIYFMVDDVNFGTSYYQSEFSPDRFGINYKLMNIKKLSFYIFTVVKARQLEISFYIERVDEGILLYAFMGITMEEAAASRVDLSSAAKKRLDLIKGWIIDGIMEEAK
jgi:hypothetical protein